MENPTKKHPLYGQTVIVGGAGGKIGRVVCSALGEAGASLVINDIKKEAVDELVASFSSKGYPVLGCPTAASSGETIVQKAVEKFGTVHAIVNATLGPIAWKQFEEVTDDQFFASFSSNVLGPLSLIRAAWPHFKKQKYGRVVNFTSDSILGMPTASDYTMTKGALFGVNKTLAMEGAAYNIKVNCVSPIAYAPSMEPQIKRFSEPIQELFHTLYTPEANVPMILALVSEGCSASGEVFSTAGWAMGRYSWAVQYGATDLKTVDDCLGKLDDVCEKKPQSGYEPTTMVDFTEFQADFILKNRNV